MTRQQMNSRGFTLFEMVVAILIFGILVSLAVLNQSQFLPGFRLSAGVRQVVADLQLVRAKTISQNHQFRVVFTPANTYQVQRHDRTTGAWLDYSLYGRGAAAITSGQPLHLPEDVVVQSTTTITFRPRGSAVSDADGYVRVNHSRLAAAAARDVVVGLNGLVRVN